MERMTNTPTYKIILCSNCGRQWNNTMCLVCGPRAYGREVDVAPLSGGFDAAVERATNLLKTLPNSPGPSVDAVARMVLNAALTATEEAQDG